jgi:hypothetical protein
MITTRKKSARSARLYPGGSLLLTVGKKQFGYHLDALEHQLGRDARCYRLRKFAADVKPGETDHYDVVLTPGWNEGCQCECKGYLRHRHCKHIESLLALHAAGKLA